MQQLLVRHFAGGDALFSGVALVALAAGCGWYFRSGWRRRGVRLAGMLGGAIVAVSAVPLPNWLYALGGFAAIAWLATLGGAARTRRFAFAALLIAWCAAAAGIEIAFRTRPILPGRTFPRLVVIGDSLSAGIDARNDSAWPALFARATGVEVVDLSQAGATARSAFDQAARLDHDAALVLVEIGGNDLLGGRSSAEFGDDLERLLRSLAGSNRGIVVMELPLPPFHNGYGRRQRELAARHGAAMIPRRDLARALFTSGATVDDLHLSDAGHAVLAETLRRRLADRLR
ncbi:MAG: GDSL-type esterase/lipase family protein [Planctomycetaceae bacterium]